MVKDNKEKPTAEPAPEVKNFNQEEEGEAFRDRESRLRAAEEWFKILFDYAPDGYYISDLEGNFIAGNKAAERITGYRKEELIGKNYFQLGLLTSEYRTGDGSLFH